MAASGPSLTPDVIEAVRATGWPVLAVQDAYRAMPWCDVMYGCDVKWWRHHSPCPDFKGEKWSSHDSGTNDKASYADEFGFRCVRGMAGSVFSTDPDVICYGDCSGFQAINLAILFGATYIVLVGYDMTYRGSGHFFGDHPNGLFQNRNYENFLHNFDKAANRLPEGVQIINATPGSALKSFPMLPLKDSIENGRLHCHRSVA